MTLKATKFTPEVLLSAPRRSAAVPSPDGKKALFSVSGEWSRPVMACSLTTDGTLGVDVLV